MSYDGVHFSSVFLKGLWDPHNYGGRILYVDSRNELYIGTANPFLGCEVWKTSDIEDSNLRSYDENHYRSLWKAREIINENYSIISDNMPAILKFLQKEHYHRFINDDDQ